MNHLFNRKAFVHGHRGLSTVSVMFSHKKIRTTVLSFACCIIALLPATGASAKEYSEIEAFIQHVKATNSFATVNNIWQTDNNFDKKAMLEKVEKAQALTIDYDQVALLMKQNKTAISLELPGVGSGNYTVELAQFNFLPNDFQVHLKGANNSDDLFSYTPGLYYRGVVKGIPGSVAAFSFFNNEVYGVFSIPGEGNYVLVPNIMVGNYYDKNPHYVLYNDNDLKIKNLGPKCGADQLPGFQPKAARTTTTPNNNVYNNCTEVRVFETADFALYKTKASNATTVTNYLTALFNNQSTLYRNEGVPIVLKYVVVNTSSDIYQGITTSNSSLFLNAFSDATQNTLHNCDVALLVSTALNGGYGALGGVAWLKGMCHSYDNFSSGSYGPYGFCDMDNSGVTNFPTFSWDVEVITHEMGHIVGSPHTHACCWNPPARNTAIDGCYTLEGSCPNPGNPTPAVGGTIMSYCHLTSTGINFANGFGQQPGDTIRYFLRKTFSTTCGEHYNPTVALATSNRTILANRECTDIASGDTTTYYWKDNNTADQGDDTLVLIILKHGNNIGNLNTSGFSVSTSTLAGYGGGTGQAISFPSSTPGTAASNMGMRRYWKVNATTTPVTPVEVLFPFLKTDTTDVSGGAGTSVPLSAYNMYKVNGSYNPDPSAGFSGAASSSFSMYTYNPVPSTSKWSLTTIGATNFAHMKMTDLTGGGSGFYAVGSASVNTIESAGIFIYPNPADKFLNIERNDVKVGNVQLRDVQGKILLEMVPDAGKSVITVPVHNLASGLYFLQLQTERGFFTSKVVIMK